MRRSRHSRLVLGTVASAFVCAEAEGFGVGVAVTYRELILGRVRLFRRPVLQRFRLAEVHSVSVRRSRGVNRLLFQVGDAKTNTVMVLYGAAAVPDFDRLVAAIGILSRRQRRPALQLRRRDIDRMIALGGGSRREERREAGAGRRSAEAG